MHTSIHYDLSNPVQAHAKAIQDVKDWLGEKYEKVSLELGATVKAGCTLEVFEMMVSFAGIQGYPAKAWYVELGGTKLEYLTLDEMFDEDSALEKAKIEIAKDDADPVLRTKREACWAALPDIPEDEENEEGE